MVRGWWTAAWILVGCSGSPTPPAKPSPEAAEAPAKAGRGKRAKAEVASNFEEPKPDPARPVPAGKPNVLILVWDTVRADHLTPYGYGLDTTPRLAAFAKESLVFERAVSPGMWTLPSHASMFTGLPESAHGATAEHHWLDKRFTTAAESFLAAGWSTYLFAANPYLQDHTNLGQGFEKREFPTDARWEKKSRKATMSKVLPDDASNTLGPAYKPGKYASGRSSDKTKDAGPVAAEALGTWLDERPDKDRPFFAVVNYMEAHIPRVPSMASRRALFSEDQIRKQLTFDQSFGNLLAYTVELIDYTPEELALVEQVYDACLRDLDAATGALFDDLAKRGLLDDTIVVVTADHGEHLGDHHRADHKFSVYNALVRVPLIIRFPKQIPAGRVSEPVSNLDLFGTLGALTGVPVPEGSLSRNLLQRTPPPEAYTELVEPTRAVFDRMKKPHPDFDTAPWERTYVAVEAAQHKCIARSDGHVELYDMLADPQETKDLAPAQPALAKELCARTEAWRASFPKYDPTKAGADDGPGTMTPEMRKHLEELGYLSREEDR